MGLKDYTPVTLVLLLAIIVLWNAFEWDLFTNFITITTPSQKSELSIKNINHEYSVFTTNNWGLTSNATNEMCHYSQYLSQPRNMKFTMCLREHGLISDTIRKHRSWYDCNVLPKIYNHLLKFSNNSNKKKYFLDIGGNIGACSFTMAIHYNDLSIIAFEPVASNRFYFKNTMITNNFHNLKLVECAVGNDASLTHKTIYSYDNNMGDSRIAINNSQMESDSHQRGSYHSQTICLTTINTVMANEYEYENEYERIIPLIKMDVQGYEYFALKGASNLFANPKLAPLVIKTEFAPMMIRATNSTPIDILNLMDKYGYDIYKTYNPKKNKCIRCPFKYRIYPSGFQKFVDSFHGDKETEIYAVNKLFN